MDQYIKCECGRVHKISLVETVPPKKNGWWKTQSSARFERVNDGPLTQVWPEKPQRAKSLTRTRAEQSIALGCACFACAFSLVSPLPFLADATIFTSASTFILSVALGQENRDTIFKLLDRNRDGKLNLRDVEHAVHAVLDEVLEPEDTHRDAPQIIGDDVAYGYAIDRRMPDGTLVRRVLLPNYPRYVTKEKLKQCARLYFEILDNGNFSRRQSGEPFGDDIAQVQTELEAIGYIVKQGKAKNAPHIWTAEGERWLKAFL